MVFHRGLLWRFSTSSRFRTSTLFYSTKSNHHYNELCTSFPECIDSNSVCSSDRDQGASAVLIYSAIEVPLAQPRALFGGHFLGAPIGVIITKLFQLLPTEERFHQLSWLAASLSCAVAVVVMQITRTTHPPAGEKI